MTFCKSTAAGSLLLISLAATTHAQDGENRGPVTFASLDADSDGKVTLEEFKENFKPPARNNGRTPQPDRIFGRWDADGDGSLTVQEIDNRPRRGGQRPNQWSISQSLKLDHVAWLPCGRRLLLMPHYGKPCKPLN